VRALYHYNRVSNRRAANKKTNEAYCEVDVVTQPEVMSFAEDKLRGDDVSPMIFE
jgi:hypothetical protein